MKDKLTTNAQSEQVSPPAAKPLLGEVAQTGWENYYRVVINYEGKDYKWVAVRCKNLAFHYTKEVWSNDTFGLKRSVKKKMKQMVEDAVCNLA